MATAFAYENHPAAELFPLLAEAEFESFKSDVATNGLLEPIWLCDGKILDGRNRYRACSELGIEASFREYTGESPVAFAWSLNGKRRHLTRGQLAVIAHKMIPELRGEAERRELSGRGSDGSGGRGHKKNPLLESTEGLKTTNEVAAEIVGVGSSMVQQVNYVAKANASLLEKIESGEISANAAYEKVKNGTPIPAKPKHLRKEDREKQIRDLVARGYRKEQIATEIGLSEDRVGTLAHELGIKLPLSRSPKIQARRVIESTVHGLEGGDIALDAIKGMTWTDICADDAREWAASLSKSINGLNWLRRKLEEIARGNE